jgi:hypothetical protein
VNVHDIVLPPPARPAGDGTPCLRPPGRGGAGAAGAAGAGEPWLLLWGVGYQGGGGLATHSLAQGRWHSGLGRGAGGGARRVDGMGLGVRGGARRASAVRRG